MKKKLISIVVPIYNEKETIFLLHERVTAVMSKLSNYEYEIVFFDDGSTDGSDVLIKELCERDSKVHAVSYTKNFGYLKNTFYAVQQAKGDCAVLLHSDLQNPPEAIPDMIVKWEEGCKIVLGVKNKSKENKFTFFIRNLFYKSMNYLSEFGQISQATEFELFDRSFIENVLQNISYDTPYLRGIIMEYGSCFGIVEYVQEKRSAGKSKFNFYKYYNFSMAAVVNTSKKLLRLMMPIGLFFGGICLLEFFAHFLPFVFLGKINDFITERLILRAGLFLLSVQLIFTSFLGEYVISSNKNSQRKPMVIEKWRINY